MRREKVNKMSEIKVENPNKKIHLDKQEKRQNNFEKVVHITSIMQSTLNYKSAVV